MFFSWSLRGYFFLIIENVKGITSVLKGAKGGKRWMMKIRYFFTHFLSREDDLNGVLFPFFFASIYNSTSIFDFILKIIHP